MNASKNKRKKTSNSNFLFILILVAVIFLFSHPSLQPIRDSMGFTILYKAAVSGVVLFFTWIWEKKSFLLEKLILSVFALSPWLAFIIKSEKNSLLFHMILLGVFVIIYAGCFATNKKCSTVTGIVTLFLILRMLLATDKYTYLHNSGSIHFWKIGLIAAVFATAACIILMIKRKIRLKNNSIPERLAASLLVFGGVFILTAFTFNNLNYSLDRSKPVRYRAKILEKDIHSGCRGFRRKYK